MQTVTIARHIDFDAWRKTARTLVAQGVPPEDVLWHVAEDDAELFGAAEVAQIEAPAPSFTVPAGFLELARPAILHRERERLALMYRVLWRVIREPGLIDVATDPDIARLRHLAKEVSRDKHKMKAFVRFREVGRERESRFIAWFEPAHRIVEATAPFFENRFADMAWSILTPDCCAHWDGHRTLFTEGAPRVAAPAGDPLEEIWRSYYASIFNPARLKVKAMKAEMPVRYWRNLPEASLIAPLIAGAARHERAMIESPPTAPLPAPQRKEERTVSTPKATTSLEVLREEAANCRACPLWKDATQTVFGEGPAHAPVMMVGEQPGDKEDLAGKPFVGPAGQMLDRALKDAGIKRDKVYVTNAVKHFKFVPRGKIRLHQKPSTPEIRACHQWYAAELAAVRPELVVAMGATAAQSVLGKITPINKSRGRLIALDDGRHALVTVHPSYLLRLPDQDAREREYERFVDDLKLVAEYLHKHRHGSHAA